MYHTLLRDHMAVYKSKFGFGSELGIEKPHRSLMFTTAGFEVELTPFSHTA